jgi:hypothetical protein
LSSLDCTFLFPFHKLKLCYIFSAICFSFSPSLYPEPCPRFKASLPNLKGDFAPAVTQVKIVLKFFLESSPFFKVNNSLFTIFYNLSLLSRGFKKFSKNSYKFFYFSYIRPRNSQKSSLIFKEFLKNFSCYHIYYTFS